MKKANTPENNKKQYLKSGCPLLSGLVNKGLFYNNDISIYRRMKDWSFPHNPKSNKTRPDSDRMSGSPSDPSSERVPKAGLRLPKAHPTFPKNHQFHQEMKALVHKKEMLPYLA